MKLHWSPRSPFVRKVTIAAHELGLFERLTLVRSVVAMTAPNRALMRDNPLSKLPTLIADDGQAICDSLVICTYFDSLHDGQPLVPRDEPARWQALQRHAMANGFLDLLTLFRNERDRPDGARSQPHLDGFAVKLEAMLEYVNTNLPAVTEGRMDLVQISFGCVAGYLDFRFPDIGWRSLAPQFAEWAAWFDTRRSAVLTVPQ